MAEFRNNGGDSIVMTCRNFEPVKLRDARDGVNLSCAGFESVRSFGEVRADYSAAHRMQMTEQAVPLRRGISNRAASRQRLGFSILNGPMFFIPPKPLPIAGLWLSYPERLAIAWSAALAVAFLLSVRAQLAELYAEDKLSSRQ